MATLREIKDHIASVRSTLKITSAMKLVSSAKLRKAQQAAEGIRPYTEALTRMLAAVLTDGLSSPQAGLTAPPSGAGPLPLHPWADRASGEDSPSASKPSATGKGPGRVAIVAVASNSSLCGAFNVNVIHKVNEVISDCRANGEEVEVIPVGRKMAEAMRKEGFVRQEDWSDLVGRGGIDRSSALAQSLIDAFNAGRYSSVLLIYNHFVSTASQKVTVERYLPFVAFRQDGSPLLRLSGKPDPSQQSWAPPVTVTGDYDFAGDSVLPEPDYILEPSRGEILETLLPMVMRLRIHAVILDSLAAEHAARMLAMQAASDNAEDLLSELTLEYNKGRQQKITSELLDLAAGAGESDRTAG